MEELDRFTASLTEEGRYRLLVEAVTDYAIYMLDAQGRVSSWNPGARRFKGYEAAEILGRHFSRFYTDEDRTSGLPARALQTAARDGRFENEGWRVRKDGSRFWAHVIIDPITDDNGVLVGYAKVTRDLTERMETQKALDAAREALVQSQKMEAIGQLTGGIAHDFNNLLMAVLVSLELLKKRLPDDPRAVALLENAVQGAERGTALTQRMLAFARRQALDPKPLDIPALVRGMTDLLQSSVGASVDIETRFPLRLPQARADGHQLELALLNLVVNARDAMPNGGSITISATGEDVGEENGFGLRAGPYIRLSVADTGTGMDEATLARAAEPFFTTKGVGKGTGLGLSMVHGLAEQSGGRLVLRSGPRTGTIAEIWLPVAGADVTAASPGPDAVAAPRSKARPRTILAVDDDALVLMNITLMLEDLGHVVLNARNASDAFETVMNDPSIELVITDQAMPQMTGLQLAGDIKRARPDLPIILASGYADLPAEVDPELPRLVKPFGLKELARAVDAAVE